MTSELSFPRQFGEYVLVAQLGDDGLGTVYRALHSSDEKRFMRLRVLQSPELLPESVCSAIRNNSERATAIEHKTIVLRPEMGIYEGVPFMAWYESAGWTLDVVLAKLRAMGRQIPVEYALLITRKAIETQRVLFSGLGLPPSTRGAPAHPRPQIDRAPLSAGCTPRLRDFFRG